MSFDNNLLQQIDELVASKTFNLDALEGIKSIKDNLKAALDQLEAKTEMLAMKRQETVDLRNELASQGRLVEELRQRIAEMEKRANDGVVARFDAEKHKAVAEAWQGAMAMVFKPNAVREAVQRNHTVVVPNGNGSGYTTSVQNQDFITREDA